MSWRAHLLFLSTSSLMPVSASDTSDTFLMFPDCRIAPKLIQVVFRMKKYADNSFEELTWHEKPFNTRQFHAQLQGLEDHGHFKRAKLTRKNWMLTRGNRGTHLD